MFSAGIDILYGNGRSVSTSPIPRMEQQKNGLGVLQLKYCNSVKEKL